MGNTLITHLQRKRGTTMYVIITEYGYVKAINANNTFDATAYLKYAMKFYTYNDAVSKLGMVDNTAYVMHIEDLDFKELS
jgi:hypothetical protein